MESAHSVKAIGLLLSLIQMTLLFMADFPGVLFVLYRKRHRLKS